MRPVWAEINLSAIKNNIEEIKGLIPKTTKIMAIVKANAYGHGSVAVAVKAIESGADYLGVAILDEAVELRENGILAPILILGYTPKEDYPVVVRNDITQTIYSYEQAKNLSDIALLLNKTAKVHIKVDSGMCRIGFKTEMDSLEEIKNIASLSGLEIEGIFTHFANADASDKSYSKLQLERFLRFCQEVEKAGVKVKFRHAANSAAIIDLPEAHLDMVRPGIIIYGLYPSAEVKHGRLKLIPSMSLKTRIVHLKDVSAGSCVGYGCTYTTSKLSKIATIPLGYADGWSRLLSNIGQVLVRGQQAPLVGRICMDQCMLDVSDVEDVMLEDEVVLFGKQGKTTLSVDAVAKLIGTINYEVLCMISNRVPRLYVE